MNDDAASSYYKELYLKSIACFNDFYEDEPRKTCKEDFLDSFLNTYYAIKENGYSDEYAIPVNKELQLYDGAHRLSVATYLNIDIPVKYMAHSDCFDYKFFRKRHISSELADIGALEYVKHNDKAHIVQVFPMVNTKLDKFIENVLEEYGFIYYKKEFPITYNGVVRIKRINYGKEEWVGNIDNNYAGLRQHALSCMGYHKMRVYVFVCDSVEAAVKAKSKIRKKIKHGNFPIHINDSHDEAEKLANIFFDKNGLDWINSTRFSFDFNDTINEVKTYCSNNIPLSDLCVSSSSVLNLYGLRKAEDIDCISTNHYRVVDFGRVSSHQSEKKYYSKSFNTLIFDYSNHFLVDGVKFLSMKQLLLFKIRRHEWPKDFKDIWLIVGKKSIRKAINYIKTGLVYTPFGIVKKIRH